MNSREADELGQALAQRLESWRLLEAYAALEPVLEQRTPFRLLDRIAAGVGQCPQAKEFLELIAECHSEGGWVIIGGVLGRHYPSQPVEALAQCRRYIIAADRWYGADILGERVAGPALVTDFDQARVLLSPWRSDANRWVRRSVGVAIHFWAKRSRGDPMLLYQVRQLLDFLTPMFTEKEMDAVKGVGWGLKTMGKYYPQQLADWLAEQAGRPHRRLMVRKAMTYLPDEYRQHIKGIYGL